MCNIIPKKLKPDAGIISQTFTSSTTAIECGYQIIQTLLNNNHFGKKGKNMILGDYFNQQLKKLHKKMPSKITGPYGLGGMIAFTPYNGDPEKVLNFLHRLYNNGLMGFISGKNPLRMRFLLPLERLEKDIDEATKIIDKTLRESK